MHPLLVQVLLSILYHAMQVLLIGALTGTIASCNALYIPLVRCRDILKGCRANQAEARAQFFRLGACQIRQRVTCTRMWAQVEAYSVMTEPILDAMRFFTPFGFDVLSFVLVDRLASGREKLKADGLNISDWLQART